MPDLARAYIELAFSLEQHLPGYIDGYFGPEEWKHADKRPLEELEQDAETLAAVEGLKEPERRVFLGAQVRAMRTSIGLLQGRDITYVEEVRGLYDVEAERVPETTFERAIAKLNDLLPGSGGIAAREQALRAKLVVPKDRLEEVSNIIVDELRKRTLARFPLLEGETFELHLVSNKPWGGYNWYLGDYRSRVDINTDLPTYLPNLPNLIAHEIYPGHHTEHVLKEQRLWRGAGRLEHAILLITALAHAEIPDGQLEGKLVQQEVNAAKDGVYAGFLSFALFILLVWLKPPGLRYFNSDNLFLLPLALFMACYFVLFLARKWRVREMETKT